MSNYFWKLLLAIVWGVEAVFLFVLAVAILLLENLLFLFGYKRGDWKWIRKVDKFVEKETFRGKFIWSQ